MWNSVLSGLILVLGVFLISMRRRSPYTQAIKKVIEKTTYKQYLKFILAQAQLESNYGQSRLAKECKNLFGMKIPKKRSSFRIADPHKKCGDYSKFASFEDSVRDFVLYLDYIKTPNNIVMVSQYGEFLKKHKYFTDPLYIEKLKKYYAKL